LARLRPHGRPIALTAIETASGHRDRDGERDRAIAEGGASLIVGGNICGYTRTMTAAVALATSTDLPDARARTRGESCRTPRGSPWL
jgi:hypothetical protein